MGLLILLGLFVWGYGGSNYSGGYGGSYGRGGYPSNKYCYGSRASMPEYQTNKWRGGL